MARHISAWMDGEALESAGPFLIQKVTEDAPALELSETERLGRYGTGLSGRKRQKLVVRLEVAVRERFDLALRARALEKLAAWAQGSVLELSNHPERALRVVCTAEPALGDVRNYAESIPLEFTAYDVPFWEDRTASAVTLTFSGTEMNGSLLIPGTAETPVSLKVKPSSGTLTGLTVAVGGNLIELSGLSVAAGQTLTIGRDAHDNLAILSPSGASLLSARTAESADDLTAKPVTAVYGFTANTGCQVTFQVKGRWL